MSIERVVMIRRMPINYGRGWELHAQDMTTQDIRAHLGEMYDADVWPDLTSRVTDGVLEELAEWQSRRLAGSTRLPLIDALTVKIRDEGWCRTGPSTSLPPGCDSSGQPTIDLSGMYHD
jgi:Transposase, Mutator family